jgi:lysophospholipase L1-like esterase
MKNTCFSILFGAAALGTAASFSLHAADSDNFYLKDGDRVVFYGDSITDQRLYTTFTETYAVTRFPKMDVAFIHSGWGGDRVTGGGGGKIDQRLERDVFAYKPTVMTIMLGMNDGSYRAFDEKIFGTYTNGYQHIIDSVQEHLPNIRLTLIEPSPYDDVTHKPNFPGGYNAVLLKYSDYVKELAEREHATVADLNKGVTTPLEKANETNHELALKIVPDRVHPGPGGHLLMAGQLLKAWNAPSVVSTVELDASTKKAVHLDRAKVSDISGENGLSWTEKEEALPMPIDFGDPVVALAINSSDFVPSLDEEILKVSGLNGAHYTLKIDGQEIGNFSGEELGKGINLATMKTPMAEQAKEVHKLTLKHNDIHFLRWRQVQVKESPELPHLKQALAGLDALEHDVVKEQRAAAQPKEHKYEIAAAGQ